MRFNICGRTMLVDGVEMTAMAWFKNINGKRVLVDMGHIDCIRKRYVIKAQGGPLFHHGLDWWRRAQKDGTK